jgi:acyl transferase domain-containing protein
VSWKQEKKVAGVSSFGFSGTNSHVILSHHRAEESVSYEGEHHVVVAGKTVEVLESLARLYGDFIVEQPVLRVDVLQGGFSGKGLKFECTGRRRKELLKQLKSADLKALTTEEQSVVGKVYGADGFPRYQFERKSFWIEKEMAVLKTPMKLAGEAFAIDHEHVGFLVDMKNIGWYDADDHVVFGEKVVPGAAHLCGVIEQCWTQWKWKQVVLRRVEIREAVVLSEESECMLQYVFNTSRMSWEVRQYVLDEWKVHAQGLCMEGIDRIELGGISAGRTEIESRLWDDLDGIRFGPSFRWLQ